MFATCIYAELSLTCVKALFDHGLNDYKFPFKEEDCPAHEEKGKFKSKFLQNQKLFNPPYLRLNSTQIWNNLTAKPLQLDEGKLLGRGAFGDVYKVWIHPDQRSFSSGADTNGMFAMKVTKHAGTLEVSFHREMENLAHHHLLKCLASFTFSAQYNMIYEKADCDVEKFMEDHSDPRDLDDMQPEDLAQQLFGLADALSLIHNRGQSDPGKKSGLLTPEGSKQKTGFIHDIKPENILMFIYNQGGKKTYWFRLSDFSCAKVVDVLTSVSGKNKYSYQTVSKSGTPNYRAPEATGTGKTSRPYDLWSLGCVFLELLVWYLDGYTALREFRDKRECRVTPGGREDEGFYYKAKESDKFKLRDLVMEKIERVSNHCEGALQDVAKLIPKLLEIDPKCRLTAEQLVTKLEHIDTGLRPPEEIASGQHHVDSTSRLSAPLELSDTDSDSSFGGMVRIQHPTE
ncbi:kinase-like protein [Didymella exigua CBS 183.55]|uniref:Kinase-like protein n=1 Tax=Didymella exigua CBS 183.55 TaxID=1150837 RepID=A0A6A5RNH9_9PLEO|nr:kinase-like protein [Didymella exigua CBS 183.55]KAF1928584.1 kinase-like protein [Didymella exigua CBS 183.55]